MQMGHLGGPANGANLSRGFRGGRSYQASGQQTDVLNPRYHATENTHDKQRTPKTPISHATTLLSVLGQCSDSRPKPPTGFVNPRLLRRSSSCLKRFSQQRRMSRSGTHLGPLSHLTNKEGLGLWASPLQDLTAIPT